MCEDENMIIPSRIQPLRQVQNLQRVAYRVDSGEVVERAFFEDNVCRVYRGTTEILLRTHFAPSRIFSVFYFDFGSGPKPSEHLCICSEDELKLISLETNEAHIIALPFKFEAAFDTSFGILLVRSKNDEESFRCPSTVYSLSHPYGELLPVLCKFKDGHLPSGFVQSRYDLVPSLSTSKYVAGFDSETGSNCVFVVRKCSEEEKKAARTDLSMIGNRSIYNTPGHDLTSISSLRTPHSTRTIDQSTPLGMNLSIRQRFRAPPGISPASIGRTSDRGRVTEGAAQIRLLSSYSQRTMCQQPLDCTRATSVLSAITGQNETEFDENAVELLLECVWREDAARCGPAPRSPSRLPVIHTPQVSAAAAKRAGKMRNKVAQDILDQITKETSQNSRATLTFTTKDLSDREFFVLVCTNSNQVKLLEMNARTTFTTARPSVITGADAIPLVGKNFWLLASNNPTSLQLCSGIAKVMDISCCLAMNNLRMTRIAQLVVGQNMEFEVVAEFAVQSALNANEPAQKKPRAGFSSPRKRTKSTQENQTLVPLVPTQSQLQTFAPRAKNSPSPSTSHSTTQRQLHLFRCKLDQGWTTAIGRQLLETVIVRLRNPDTKLQFVSEWLMRNNYRLLKQRLDNLDELEVGLVFEALFEAVGVDPFNFGFLSVVKSVKKSVQQDENTPLLDEKRVRKEEVIMETNNPYLDKLLALRDQLDPKPQLEPALVTVQPHHRKPYMSADELMGVFKALFEQFEAWRRCKQRREQRRARLLAQPLRIIADLVELKPLVHHIAAFYPDLHQLQLNVPVRLKLSAPVDLPKLDPVESLTDQMEHSLLIPKHATANANLVITGAQRTKLRILPTSDEIAKWVRVRWPTDIRVNNVSTMLDSSRPILIPDLRHYDIVPESQIREFQEKFLQNTAMRTITRPFGAAILHFQSLQSEAMEATILQKINLSGRVAPSNMNLDYPLGESAQSKISHKQLMSWANFFSGVSRGLATILGAAQDSRRLHEPDDLIDHHFHLYGRKKSSQIDADTETFNRVNAEQREQDRRDHFHIAHHAEDDGPHVVDWEWVFRKFREDKECNPALAGYLLAAGLSGQSMSVNPYDLHEFLALTDKFVVVALLLGTSVAYRGTSNVYMNKMLYAHLPFLLQPTYCDFRISPTVQTAAILGLGYLFAETMHAQLTNDLLNQMSRETFFETDPGSERYAYVLSAGFATGLINLGLGEDLAQLELPVATDHLRFHERLFVLLNGGRRDLVIVSYQRDPCGVAQRGCCSCGMSRADQRYQPQQHQHHHRQRIDSLNAGSSSAAGGSASGATSSVAAASSHVAELATVNVHLAAPAACAALTLMYLRTNNRSVARRLAIPEELVRLGQVRPDLIMLRTLARCLVLFDDIGQSAHWLEAQIPATLRRHFRLTKKPAHCTADLAMLARAYLYSKAGACLAMALKHPSTWNATVTQTLKDAFDQLSSKASFAHSFMLNKAGQNAMDTCVNVLMSALAIVNAGSGDLELVRAFRRVRNQNTNFLSAPRESLLYSTHVIANMSLGLLFAGHGRFGLSMSDMSVASLLIAFYPVYAHAVYDNRCYFQAFRFLWTLAVEPRFLVTVADGSQQVIEANLTIRFKDENCETLQVRTPYLLPPLETISFVQLDASGFESFQLDLKNPEEIAFLREVVTKMSGRMPLKKSAKSTTARDFSNLPAEPHLTNDPDLDDLCLDDLSSPVELVD